MPRQSFLQSFGQIQADRFLAPLGMTEESEAQEKQDSQALKMTSDNLASRRAHDRLTTRCGRGMVT
jgi:hypothetical protein